ncbi:hypothetical protein IJ135_02530 [Candidatus Saccharibacteria bacterium]|nr:hypothetical protein [Candidatus Saccharibacteria bacterium]
MLIPVVEKNDESVPEDKKRDWNDLLKNATTCMMSWAEKNFKQKLIDNLYKMEYYKYNQTIYLTSPIKKEKE